MLNKLKSFVNDNIMDLPDEKGRQVPPPTAGATPISGVAPTQSVTASYLDADMVADIEKVIDRRSTTPFAQLKKSADLMKASGLDEGTRFKAAFSMLAAQGINALQVVQSIDVHIRDVETEKTNFETQSTASSNAKVGGLRAEIEQLNAQQQTDQQTIASLQQQIVQLQTRMAERTGVITQKSVDANTAESQIQQTISKFKAAADSVIASLNLKKTTLSSTLS
jgi:hypothetical protein